MGDDLAWGDDLFRDTGRAYASGFGCVLPGRFRLLRQHRIGASERAYDDYMYNPVLYVRTAGRSRSER